MLKKISLYKEYFILSLVIIFNLAVNLIGYKKEYYLSELSIFLMGIILALILVNKSKLHKSYFICVTIVVALIWAISVPVYSPIDEGAHFSYINYICDYGKLPVISDVMNSEQLGLVSDYNVPVGIMYEAVHPPVYYLLMALMCSCFNNVSVRFWLCRTIGVVFLACMVSVLYRWIEYLCEKEVINEEQKTLFLKIALVTCLMPGLLTRFVLVTNEGLVTLLATVCLYKLTKCLFEGITFGGGIKISVFIALCFLTKITVAFIVVLWILILVYYKEYKKIFVSSGCFLLISLPWFVYNWKLYGALTGNAEHLAFVRPIVNPNQVEIDVFSSLSTIFTDMVYPKEGQLTQIVNVLVDFLDVVILLMLLFWGVTAVKNIIKYMFHRRCLFVYDTEEKIEVLNILYFLCILGNIAVLVIGSVGSNVLIIIGRYLYLSLIPFIYIAGSYITRRNEKHCVIYIYAVLIYILCIHNIYGYNETRLSQLTGYLCEKENIDFEDAVFIDVKQKGEKLITEGNDPQIVINDLDVDNVVGIELQMSAEQDGEFVLYYNDGEGFKEECKIQSIYVSNYEKLRFIFPESINVKDIRIDPPTNYIFSIEQLMYVK